MEHNRYCDTSGKSHGGSMSGEIPRIVNNNWQKGSSRNHQHNGITLFNQEKDAKGGIFWIDSAAVQVHRTGWHGNPPHDFGKCSGSDHWPDWATWANKPEKQKNTFWFPTPISFGENDDHTPIQTRILKKQHELKEREKLNPKYDTESRTKFLKRYNWTDTLLTEA